MMLQDTRCVFDALRLQNYTFFLSFSTFFPLNFLKSPSFT